MKIPIEKLYEMATPGEWQVVPKNTPIQTQDNCADALAITGTRGKGVEIVAVLSQVAHHRASKKDHNNTALIVHTRNHFKELLSALRRISNGNDVGRMAEWANDALTAAETVEMPE